MSATTDLIAAAREARDAAYAPYSGYAVGCAVATADGRVFAGANVENASFGLSICAERAAICAAVNAGARAIVAVAVVGPDAAAAAPCGACRQVIAEFASPEVPVVYFARGTPVETTSGALLPAAFGLASSDAARGAG